MKEVSIFRDDPSLSPVRSAEEGPEWVGNFLFDGIEPDDFTRSMVRKHFMIEKVKGVGNNKADIRYVDEVSYVSFAIRGKLGVAFESALETMRPLVGSIIVQPLIKVTLVPLIELPRLSEGNREKWEYDLTQVTKSLLDIDQ